MSKSEKKRLQVSLNAGLHSALMSIPQTSRGQFVNIALAKFINSEDGKNLLKHFASEQPDIARVKEEIKSDGGLDSIMGEF
ncbi:hypothetical protein ADMFC3_00400 [Geovibrio sp. ADMFC3]